MDADVAFRGKADRVGKKVDQNLPQAGDIAGKTGWQVGRNVPVKFDLLFARLERHAIDRFLDQHLKIERMVLQLELARLDLGEIENVADDGQERVGALADGLRVILLLRVELGAEQQTGHADDRIHRGADFVAHVGQEFRLGLVGLLGGVLRGDQLFLDLLALGDVLGDAAIGDQLALGIVEWRAAGREPDDIPLLGLRPVLEIAETLPLFAPRNKTWPWRSRHPRAVIPWKKPFDSISSGV